LATARCARLSRCSASRLYVELQRHGRPEEKQVEPGLLDLAYANGIALVATNEPFYGRREDFEAHDA
jgi:DNA polymerase-3 subunit alpha